MDNFDKYVEALSGAAAVIFVTVYVVVKKTWRMLFPDPIGDAIKALSINVDKFTSKVDAEMAQHHEELVQLRGDLNTVSQKQDWMSDRILQLEKR